MRAAVIAGLGLCVALASASAHAAVSLPSNPVVDMRIDYAPPSTVDPQAKLAGNVLFWVQDVQNAGGLVGPVASFDIGPLRPGQHSVFEYFLAPHCARTVCELLFSFAGQDGAFPAEALPTGASPSPTVPPDPVIPLVGPADFNNLLHNVILEESGPIFAWDSPVQIGT